MAEDGPPPTRPARPKLPAEERRRRREDRLAALRLRVAIGRALDERGIAGPAAIGAAFGLPAGEAAKLLVRHQWREEQRLVLPEPQAPQPGTHVSHRAASAGRGGAAPSSSSSARASTRSGNAKPSVKAA